MESAVHNHVACGHTGYLAHFVAHKHYGCLRPSGAYVVEHCIKAVLEMFVKVAQGFVEDKHSRFCHESPGQEGALELAS